MRDSKTRVWRVGPWGVRNVDGGTVKVVFSTKRDRLVRPLKEVRKRTRESRIGLVKNSWRKENCLRRGVCLSSVWMCMNVDVRISRNEDVFGQDSRVRLSSRPRQSADSVS